jgi:hypothetical protein
MLFVTTARASLLATSRMILSLRPTRSSRSQQVGDLDLQAGEPRHTIKC